MDYHEYAGNREAGKNCDSFPEVRHMEYPFHGN